MIALLDTSTEFCRLTLIKADNVYSHEVEMGRRLAKDLLAFVERSLLEHGATFDSLSSLGVYRGPGSYTGLRIGITVWNTIADARQIPIVGVSGELWQREALERLRRGDDDRIVLPEYGGEARITAPRK